MSLMNLQKLRQVCYRDDHDRPSMKISLAAYPLNRVIFTDDQGKRYTVQLDTIIGRYGSPSFEVYYNIDEHFSNFDEGKMIGFNRRLARIVLPRLEQVLVENGFHEKSLPIRVVLSEVPFILLYPMSGEFEEQIYHACYTDGRSMRRAVEFQAKLNKT